MSIVNPTYITHARLAGNVNVPSNAQAVLTSIITDLTNGVLLTAPTFSETTTYAVGIYVKYNDSLYICHTAVESPGAWTGNSNWNQVNNLLQLFSINNVSNNLNNIRTSVSDSTTAKLYIDNSILAACPYAVSSKITGDTLDDGTWNLVTVTSNDITLTLPDCLHNKAVDIIMLIDCLNASDPVPSLTVNGPTGKTIVWLDGQSALTYATGKIYMRVYTLFESSDVDTRIVTYHDKELIVRATDAEEQDDSNSGENS